MGQWSLERQDCQDKSSQNAICRPISSVSSFYESYGGGPDAKTRFGISPPNIFTDHATYLVPLSTGSQGSSGNRIQFFIQKRLKNTNITAEYTSTGLLLPSKASHTLAQTMEYFQGYYKRLGFCVNKSKNQDHGYQGYTNTYMKTSV